MRITWARLVRGSARRWRPGMRPATAMYRKPAAASAKAYGSAPIARCRPKYAATPPMMEVRPVSMIMPVRLLMSVTARVTITIPVRVPPQHELLDDKEHTETHQQRRPDRVRAVRPNTLHRLR